MTDAATTTPEHLPSKYQLISAIWGHTVRLPGAAGVVAELACALAHADSAERRGSLLRRIDDVLDRALGLDGSRTRLVEVIAAIAVQAVEASAALRDLGGGHEEVHRLWYALAGRVDEYGVLTAGMVDLACQVSDECPAAGEE